MATKSTFVLLMAVTLLIAAAPSANSLAILGNSVEGIIGTVSLLCTPTGNPTTGLPVVGVAGITVTFTLNGVAIGQGVTDSNGNAVIVANLLGIRLGLIVPSDTLLAVVKLPITSVACPALQTVTGVLSASLILTPTVQVVGDLLYSVVTVANWAVSTV